MMWDSAGGSCRLSKTQEAFWWLSQAVRGVPARSNHLPLVITLRGELDLQCLRAAADDLIQRHVAFRTIFTEGNELRQLPAPAEPYVLPYVDLREKPADLRMLERNRLFQKAISKPFDLCAAPPWRCLLVRLDDEHHELIAVGHHIIFDAWSQRILLTDLAELYRAHRAGVTPSLETLALTHFDYAEDQHRRLASGEMEPHIRYWVEQLQGAPLNLNLPVDFPIDLQGRSTSALPGRVERFAVPAPLLQSLERHAAQHAVTPFSVLLAGFFAWLHQVTGQTDLWTAVPVANRTKTAWKNVVGCLAQQIRPRVDLSANPTFGEVIKQTHRVMQRGLRRQDVPTSVADERWAPASESSTAVQPLRTMFAYQNAMLTRLDSAGVSFEMEMLWDMLGVAREAVVWQFSGTGSSLEGFLEYRTDLFRAEAAKRWIQELLRILGTGVDSPDERLSTLAPPHSRIEAPLKSRLPPAKPAGTAAEPIAIVGIGCRFPGGGDDPERFWELLRSGVDAVTDIPADRWDVSSFYSPNRSTAGKTYAKHGGFIANIDSFDAQFFGIAPREAAKIDPQQRLLLELTWEALEDAGIPMDKLAGTPVGVFMGGAASDYLLMTTDRDSLAGVDSHSATGVSSSIVANRISYTFDFRGPSVTLDTACSGSLVAIHQACQSIWHSGCPLAIAGGVQINLLPNTFVLYSKATLLSPTGRCRAFDAGADGFVRGEGGGVVVLKPLSAALRDQDRIYAVIRGAAVNQDGRTPSLTMPNLDAQVAAIQSALRQADLAPHTVQYVETHGPGTQVGDPIEARALGTALAPRRSETCVIGSVKTNIGHLELAAGVAGLIKLALCLWHREIPPNLHFKAPNPKIPLTELRLRVPASLESCRVTGTARRG